MKQLIDKIHEALLDMTNLTITTTVGSITPKGEVQNDPPAKVIYTRLDLLDGDIDTKVDPAFVSGDYEKLWDFHKEREQEGHRLVQQNLETLQKLLKFAAEHVMPAYQATNPQPGDLPK
jgi:hypothetical protein